MVCLTGPSFFQRKTRGDALDGVNFAIKSISGPIMIEEPTFNTHARLHSMTSTSSRSSTDSDDSARAFNPLQSHPPLQINASPVAEARSERLPSRDGPASHLHFVEFSSLDNMDSDESRPASSRRMTYVYDQGSQWPLKDWQTIPPGLADAPEATEFSTPLRPRPATHQRRPTEWMNESDRFVKRGSWKRRGIIFGPDASSDEETQRHFELPE
ncbi:hypothetical protein Micbo1qcDRAFT_193207 [Microdochium bolleyi]|uniref:Uncharacterized protein n=1 Tax=Microdochium bolleyi TaxID=196109 RepID=A0A136J9M0_9PEZI|nr:hypothetical protein Micbo1qcDRAFT_193207 [Microdochium bolleyi]